MPIATYSRNNLESQSARCHDYRQLLAWGLFVFSFVFCLLGCRDSEVKVESHVGHFIPPHRPADLGAAWHRIEQLTTLISDNGTIPNWRDVARRDPHVSLTELEKLPTTAWDELIDVVGWLPDLAIDSDLPETVWQTISEQSGAMAKLLNDVNPRSEGRRANH